MSALTSVLIELETVGIKLIPKGENLEIVGPPDALTEDIIQQLKDHKTEILRLIDQTLHGLSIEELRRLAGDDWKELKSDPLKLQAFAHLIQTRLMRERGEVPAHYTGTTHCQHCGVVPIWGDAPPQVLACVWCFNRISGNPMPC